MVTTPTHHVGSPTHLGPLSVFPIWTDAPMPRSAMRTTVPSGANVGELEGGSVVECLTVQNPTKTAFLLVGGAVFDGGWQHRVLVHSTLVDVYTNLDIDVRCVEQGRWGGSGDQRLHRRHAPLAVRGALRGIRSDRAQRTTVHADQGDVWNRVQRYEQSMGASASSSLVEVTDRLDGEARRVIAALKPLPGQRGVLIGIGGHPALMEVFDHPRTLAAQWDSILTATLADARLVPARPTPCHRARTFVRHISQRPLEPWTQAGAAIGFEAHDDLVVADGTVIGSDRLVHLSVLNARHELIGAA